MSDDETTVLEPVEPPHEPVPAPEYAPPAVAGPAPVGKQPRAARWPLIVLSIVAVAAIAFGAWAYVRGSDAEDDADRVIAASKATSADLSKVEHELDELREANETLTAANAKLTAKLKAQAAKLKAADVKADAKAASEADSQALIEQTRAIVASSAAPPFDECAKITLVGISGDYAITRAELDCGSSQGEPGEFMFKRAGDRWEPVSAQVFQAADPALDSGVICGAVSKASSEIRSAIDAIC